MDEVLEKDAYDGDKNSSVSCDICQKSYKEEKVLNCKKCQKDLCLKCIRSMVRSKSSNFRNP